MPKRSCQVPGETSPDNVEGRSAQHTTTKMPAQHTNLYVATRAQLLSQEEDGGPAFLTEHITGEGACTIGPPHTHAAAAPQPHLQHQHQVMTGYPVRSSPLGNHAAAAPASPAAVLAHAHAHVQPVLGAPGAGVPCVAGNGACSIMEEEEDDEVEAAELQAAVMVHPLYPRLLEALCACRKVCVICYSAVSGQPQACMQLLAGPAVLAPDAV